MKTQNATNHKRIVPIYLFSFLLIGPICTVLSAINCFHNQNLEGILFCLISLSLVSAFYYMRTFALKAQDRAIRSEENLRYFSLTGKLFDKNLTISQIIALRFACDEELVALTEKALKENLSSTAIKKEILNWKADTHRV